MQSLRKLFVFGAGGFGREVAWIATSIGSNADFEFSGFVEDESEPNRLVHGFPALSWQDFCALHSDNTALVVAVGDPVSRKRIAARCQEAGYAFATLMFPSVSMSSSVSVGEGTVICAGTIVTVDVVIGKHVHINLDCTIGHDVRIGNYTTLSPGVHVSGNVQIGECVYIGTGATIINGSSSNPLVVADGTVVGAGACVTSSTSLNSLYVGVPAQYKKTYKR